MHDNTTKYVESASFSLVDHGLHQHYSITSLLNKHKIFCCLTSKLIHNSTEFSFNKMLNCCPSRSLAEASLFLMSRRLLIKNGKSFDAVVLYDSYEVEYLPIEGLLSSSTHLFIELSTDAAGTSTGIALRYQGEWNMHIYCGQQYPRVLVWDTTQV